MGILSNNNINRVLHIMKEKQMTKEEQWIEFDSRVYSIGNKGKSRGINLSAYTNELDINRHIVGHFRFVNDAPDSLDYQERKKQTYLTKHLDKIQEVKTYCARNKLLYFAREHQVPEKDTLTLQNLNYYLEVWAQLDAQNYSELDDSVKETQKTLLNEIENNLFEISIDVHTDFTLRGEEGVRETYLKTEYALDKKLERVVHKDNVQAYNQIKAEYIKAKQTITSQTSQKDTYLQSLTIPSFIIEAAVDDINTFYTKNALKQLDKRVDAYLKDPTAILKKKKRK